MMSEEYHDNAAAALDDDDGPPACTGRAAEALAAFRAREAELRAAGQRKPDMVAFKELRFRYQHGGADEPEHGALPGVPVGLTLRGRGEAAILGIHTSILSGIDARIGAACFAVCVSGGYTDDDDHRADGSIVYTGCGQNRGRRQVADQEETYSNASLIMSCNTGLPIRVLRGRKEGGKPVYVYDGLYVCKDYTYEPSLDGPKVYKFTLVPAAGNERPKSFAVDNQSSSSALPVKGGARIRLEQKMKQQTKKRKASAKTSRARLAQAMNKKRR